MQPTGQPGLTSKAEEEGKGKGKGITRLPKTAIVKLPKLSLTLAISLTSTLTPTLKPTLR